MSNESTDGSEPAAAEEERQERIASFRLFHAGGHEAGCDFCAVAETLTEQEATIRDQQAAIARLRAQQDLLERTINDMSRRAVARIGELLVASAPPSTPVNVGDEGAKGNSMSDVLGRAIADSEATIRHLVNLASPPRVLMGGSKVCGLHGDHGGPLCSITFAYEDGTMKQIGHEWYVKLQQAVAEEGSVADETAPANVGGRNWKREWLALADHLQKFADRVDPTDRVCELIIGWSREVANLLRADVNGGLEESYANYPNPPAANVGDQEQPSPGSKILDGLKDALAIESSEHRIVIAFGERGEARRAYEAIERLLGDMGQIGTMCLMWHANVGGQPEAGISPLPWRLKNGEDIVAADGRYVVCDRDFNIPADEHANNMLLIVRAVEAYSSPAPPAPAEDAGAGGGARCADCRRPYGDEHGFPDLVISHDAWAKITHDRDGLLCPSCLCARAHGAGLSNVPAIFTSGPFCAPNTDALDDLVNNPPPPSAALTRLLRDPPPWDSAPSADADVLERAVDFLWPYYTDDALPKMEYAAKDPSCLKLAAVFAAHGRAAAERAGQRTAPAIEAARKCFLDYSNSGLIRPLHLRELERTLDALLLDPEPTP